MISSTRDPATSRGSSAVSLPLLDEQTETALRIERAGLMADAGMSDAATTHFRRPAERAVTRDERARITLAVERLYPAAQSVVELGGQDAKIIVVHTDETTGRKKKSPSMNDKCAGARAR